MTMPPPIQPDPSAAIAEPATPASLTQPAVSGSIADRVLGVISTTKRLPRESVTPESSFESLGIDSLDRLNILFDLENEFDIQINDEDAKQVSTIQEMITGVEHLVATRDEAASPAAATTAGDGAAAQPAALTSEPASQAAVTDREVTDREVTSAPAAAAPTATTGQEPAADAAGPERSSAAPAQ